jgi:hypothetical protein
VALDVCFSLAGIDDCGSRKARHALYIRGSPIFASTLARKVFTDRRIHRAPDCVSIGHRHISCLVAISPSFALSDSDKFDALRRLDQFREWRSLDDKRFCLVCGKIINGRQIQVEGDTRGNGPPRLNCPSERCNSIPMDWVLPTDEILALAETMASEKERNIAPPGAADHSVEEHGLTSQLKKLAMQFRLAF